MMRNLIKFIQKPSTEESPGFDKINCGEDFYKNAHKIQTNTDKYPSMPPVTAKCAVSAKALFISLDRVMQPQSISNRQTQQLQDGRSAS